MSDDERKLFVGRLPLDIREQEIHMIFSTYGRVADVHILQSSLSGKAASAFVTYEDVQAAKTAVQVLDNVYKFREDQQCDPVHVSVARARRKGGGKGGDDSYGDQGGGRGDYGGYSQPFAGGYSQGGGYGGGCASYGGGGCKGYAPSYGSGYGGGHAPCGGRYGYDRKGGGDWGSGGGGKSSGGKGGDPGCKLYIGNLPADITREALQMVFSTYGQCEDIHVMQGRASSGQSCAFLTYSTPDQAKSAITAMQTGYEIRPGEGHIMVKYASAGSKGRDDGRSRPY